MQSANFKKKDQTERRTLRLPEDAQDNQDDDEDLVLKWQSVDNMIHKLKYQNNDEDIKS